MVKFNPSDDLHSQLVKFMAENESGFYAGKNSDGELISVGYNKGEGLTLRTQQSNGWVRVDEYDEDGWLEISTFDGRWFKG